MPLIKVKNDMACHEEEISNGGQGNILTSFLTKYLIHPLSITELVKQ